MMIFEMLTSRIFRTHLGLPRKSKDRHAPTQDEGVYLADSVYKVVLQKSIPLYPSSCYL